MEVRGQACRCLEVAECVGREHGNRKSPGSGLLVMTCFPWKGRHPPSSSAKSAVWRGALRREVGDRANRAKPSKLWPARQGCEGGWEREGWQGRKCSSPACHITMADPSK